MILMLHRKVQYVGGRSSISRDDGFIWNARPSTWKWGQVPPVFG